MAAKVFGVVMLQLREQLAVLCIELDEGTSTIPSSSTSSNATRLSSAIGQAGTCCLSFPAANG